MTVTPFPYRIPPISNITPFTEKDGMTYLNVLETLRSHIVTLVPHMNENMEHLLGELEKGIANAENTVSLAKDDWDGFFKNFMANVEENIAGINLETLADVTSTINIRQFGAKGNGVADDTAAIRTAENVVFELNRMRSGSARLFMPAGRYKITDTVHIRVDTDATQATLEYYGIGRAVQVGTDSPGVYITDKDIHLPKVVCKSVPDATWDGTSQGVVITNANQCRIWIPRIEHFEKGLVITGNKAGTAYSDFYIGSLWVNHENLVLDQGVGENMGWVNQNQFYGGRITHSLNRGTPDDPTACHLRLGNNVGGTLNPPDGNSFFGLSMEGANTGTGGYARHRVINYGRYNQFFNCRWESIQGIPVIVSRDFAGDNIIWGGYHASKLSLVGIPGAVTVKDGIEGTVDALDTTAPKIPDNVNTVLKSWVNPTMSKCEYIPETGMFTPARGRWRIRARITFAANSVGTRTVRLYAGPNVIDQNIQPGSGTAPSSLDLDMTYFFSGTASFHVSVQQNSGGELALAASAPYVKIQAVKES